MTVLVVLYTLICTVCFIYASAAGILQFRINITRTGQIVFDETSFNPVSLSSIIA